ncbi:MAG: hypothetical protein A3B37_03355 [Candidatus Sungbacteria bacterium RIFCSPLOWO2_01_FULL_59_16]|uniref:Putative 3-methyladenine DNA glycosylase n=1 Tax=Candidatus Sungbacteria bacterium RIFCSPLOWO2_01_FULL_59_16 TaxID=1802280 RepID=A0A1G2LC64_9BACT|nr:MAG: hypothetical protein A3B37_03355 [Candidatus Sungbacteria bacterium RIFCSPLOWO2_01_FULL_59_16]
MAKQKIATISQSFFNRSTLRVTQELLGKYLVRRTGRRTVARMITDVEAYVGFRDRASHASRGMTPRNRVMFGPAGHWYVYFTYGMHWMLNIVTGRKGYPAAVLIRGVAAPNGGEPRQRREGISGPARLTKFFKIDKRFNGRAATRATGLWIEDRGVRIPNSRIRRSKRIGVDYAGPWREKPWRFHV